MKLHRVTASLWSLLGVGLIYLGLYNLFRYSANEFIYNPPVPFDISLGKLFTGIYALMIGVNMLRQLDQKLHIILPMSVLIATYFVISMIRYGPHVLQYAGENMMFLVLLIISWKIIMTLPDWGLAIDRMKEKRDTLIISLLLGILPIVVALSFDYRILTFLH